MASSYCTMKISSLLALGIIVLIGDGVNGKPPSRIVGGAIASSGEFKYIVAVMKGGRHICGGAIISPLHIITAGHCVVDKPETVTILTGVTDLSDHNNQEHHVSKIIVHPDYKPYTLRLTVQRDIAVIVLAEPLTLNQELVKVNLPSYQVEPGEGGMFAGWGFVNRFGTYSPHLMKIPVSFLNETTCIAKRSVFSPDTLCGYSSSGSICGGDSGGPVVLESALVGIASGSRCIIGEAHIYTNVYYYRSWIISVMNRA